jgi:hypothetical protein
MTSETTSVKVGQIWEVYSKRAKRWGQATVVEVENGAARLHYDEQPDDLRSEVAILTSTPTLFRLVADVSSKRP